MNVEFNHSQSPKVLKYEVPEPLVFQHSNFLKGDKYRYAQ